MFALMQKAYEAVLSGRKFCFATIYETTKKGTPQKVGAKMIVFEDGNSFGTIGGGRNEHKAIGECLEAIQTGETKCVTYDYFGGAGFSVCGGQIKVFIDPYNETKDKNKKNIRSSGRVKMTD